MTDTPKTNVDIISDVLKDFLRSTEFKELTGTHETVDKASLNPEGGVDLFSYRKSESTFVINTSNGLSDEVNRKVITIITHHDPMEDQYKESDMIDHPDNKLQLRYFEVVAYDPPINALNGLVATDTVAQSFTFVPWEISIPLPTGNEALDDLLGDFLEKLAQTLESHLKG